MTPRPEAPLAAIPPSLLQMFGPIESLLSDPTVRRVLVDAHDAILVERHGRLERTPLGYSPDALEESLDALARRAGKPFDALHPSLEAQLKDGTRFLALRSPAVERGPVLVVVRPGGRLTDLDAMTRQASLSVEAADALAVAMRAGLNIAVVGPADSGRTSVLEALAAALPPRARVVVLEEHNELRLPEREPQRMQTRKPDKDGQGAITTADLLYFAGRMAVDRVLIGDLRWQDASECVHLLAGRLSPVAMSLPGLNTEDALARLEALARASATGGRERAVGGLLQAALDLVVTLGRLDGNRVVMQIDRVRPGGDSARIEPIFARSGATGWQLEPSELAAALIARWGRAAAALPDDGESERETLGYLPAIPLMTESIRLPDGGRRGTPPVQTPVPGPPPATEAPRLSLSSQPALGRTPMPVPKGAILELETPPAVPFAGGDPLATDNMFATLRPGLPGEVSDPLRRLLQGMRTDTPPGAATDPDEGEPGVAGPDTSEAAAAPPTIEAPVPVPPGEGDDDEEHTVVNDAISPTTIREESESRPGMTFSQVLRNLGVGPGESQEISGAWTGMNIVGQSGTNATALSPEALDQTRESDSPVAGRTTRVHATDD